MKTRKGMTLIEVLLALMILGIMAVTFLPSSVNGFRLMSNSKILTQEVFAAQQNIEDNIEHLRKDIQNSSTIDNTKKIQAKFDNSPTQVEIEGKVVIGTDNNTDLFAFIPLGKKPEDPTFPLVTVEIEPEDYFSIVDKTSTTPVTINIFRKTNSKLVGAILGKGIDYESKIYRLVHNWYVSNNDYNGTIPNFPDDYTKISTIQKDIPNLSYEDETINLQNYKNKILIYTITQVSKVGRYGEIISDPILIIDEIPKLNLGVKHKNTSGVDYANQSSPLNIRPSDKLEGQISESISGTHRWYQSKPTFTGNAGTDITDDNISDFTSISGANTNTLNNLNNYKDKWVVYSFIVTYNGETKTFYSKPIQIIRVIDNSNIKINIKSQRRTSSSGGGTYSDYSPQQQVFVPASNDRLIALIDNPDDVLLTNGRWYISPTTYNGFDFNKVDRTASEESNRTLTGINGSTYRNRVVKYGIEAEDGEIIYSSNYFYINTSTIYIIPDLVKDYKFIARNTTQVADVAYGNSDVGNPLIVYTQNDGPNQRFGFEPTDDGYYKIYVVYADGSVRYLQKSSSNNDVEQALPSNSNNQKWSIEVASSYYRFKNLSNNYYFYVNGTRSGSSYPTSPITKVILSSSPSSQNRGDWTIQAY